LIVTATPPIGGEPLGADAPVSAPSEPVLLVRSSETIIVMT
jgi:hypothetical protein